MLDNKITISIILIVVDVDVDVDVTLKYLPASFFLSLLVVCLKPVSY